GFGSVTVGAIHVANVTSAFAIATRRDCRAGRTSFHASRSIHAVRCRNSIWAACTAGSIMNVIGWFESVVRIALLLSALSAPRCCGAAAPRGGGGRRAGRGRGQGGTHAPGPPAQTPPPDPPQPPHPAPPPPRPLLPCPADSPPPPPTAPRASQTRLPPSS